MATSGGDFPSTPSIALHAGRSPSVKNFRRKPDRPRRRKRKSESQEPEADGQRRAGQKMADPSRELYATSETEKSEARQIGNQKETIADRKFVSERAVQASSTTTSSSSTCPRSLVKFNRLGSHLPEDLTVRSQPTEGKPTTMEVPKIEEEENGGLNVVYGGPEAGRGSRHCRHRRRHGNDDDDVAWIVNIPPPQNPVGSSVHELEQAMNRHLPTTGVENAGGRAVADDFRTTLAVSSSTKSGRTIRWLGSAAAAAAADCCCRLPASTLLRTLYANRESVIRTNVSASRAHPCYPDSSSSQPPLLTPPYATTGTSPSYVEPPFARRCKTPPGDGYGQSSASGGHVSFPNSASMNMLGMTSSDVYVTPPSSVSPHGKYSADGATGQRYDVTASMMTLRTTAYVSSSPYVDYRQSSAVMDTVADPLSSCYNFNNTHNNVSGFPG